jgi:hypothetical protein
MGHAGATVENLLRRDEFVSGRTPRGRSRHLSVYPTESVQLTLSGPNLSTVISYQGMALREFVFEKHGDRPAKSLSGKLIMPQLGS